MENWKSVFEWSSVVLLAFTFLAGAGVVFTSSIVNKRQAQTILGLKKDASDAKKAQQEVEISLADAKTKQAEAEKSLLELQQLIHEPRTLDETKGAAILDAREKGSVQILFVAGDEPKNLANKISVILSAHGWTVTSINMGISSIPPGIEVGVSSEDSKVGEEAPEPVKTLCSFLSESVERNPSLRAISDKGLPKNSTPRIIVGPKY